MKKQIFSEEEQMPQVVFQPKQEFNEENVHIELENDTLETEQIIEKSLKPNRFWVRVLLVALCLFGIAVIAQSVQWLVDAFQARQWIYFAFAVAFSLASLSGIGVLIREWRRLAYLRKHQQNQQISEQFWLNELESTSGQKAVTFCNEVLENLQNVPSVQHGKQRWQNELNEAYNGKEVLYLFNENVLTPLDQQVKKLISRNATENAVIVAISPLALVDVLTVAVRNFALVNKISRLYGMELGYFSRLKLFKMVLTNMVFAGATEIVSDVGMDFFSQNLTAKLSLRAAQGIGLGLLTARLGIKAMEFCRPIAFQAGEKPKLSAIRQALLTSVKDVIFAKSEEKAKENA